MAPSSQAQPVARPAGSVREALSRLSQVETAALGGSLDASSFAWGSPSAAQQQHQLYQLAFMFCSQPHASAAALCSPYGSFQLCSGSGPYHAQQLQQQQVQVPYAAAHHHQAFYPHPAPQQGHGAPALYAAAPGCTAAPPAAGAPAPVQPAAVVTVPTLPQSAPCSAKAKAAATASAAAQPRSHSKKASGSKAAKVGPAPVPATTPPSPLGAFGPRAAADIELDAEDIRKLLEDDTAFLKFHEEEGVCPGGGSNGCAAAADSGRLLVRTGSRGSLSASGALNDNILFDGSLASAFDMDVDEQATGPGWPAGSASAATGRAASADLNNLACSSPPSPVKAPAGSTPAKMGKSGGGATSKAALRVKGGVQKAANGGKAAKAGSSATVSAAAAAAAAAEEALTAADLSRLLGEDDSRIPDGWDLDLDFENPFSTPISAL